MSLETARESQRKAEVARRWLEEGARASVSHARKVREAQEGSIGLGVWEFLWVLKQDIRFRDCVKTIKTYGQPMWPHLHTMQLPRLHSAKNAVNPNESTTFPKRKYRGTASA